MIEKGKKVYRTSMLGSFRFIMLILAFSFYRDFYLETFQEPKFLEKGLFGFWDVVQYHWHYPVEIITLSILVLMPIIYYGLVRGVRFYEKGYLFNKGLPFVNVWVPYAEVKQYKLLLPRSILAMFTHAGDVHLVADGNIERVIALLDQHNVPGDLAQDAYVRLLTNIRNFFLVVLTFTGVLFLVKQFGWLRYIT